MRSVDAVQGAPTLAVIIDRPLLEKVNSEQHHLDKVKKSWLKRQEKIQYSLAHKCNGHLDIEVGFQVSFCSSTLIPCFAQILIEKLQTIEEFQNSSWPHLYSIVMNMTTVEGSAGSTLLKNNQIENLAFLVILGDVQLIDNSQTCLLTVSSGECYYQQLYLPGIVSVQAKVYALIVTFPKTLESSLPT
eukprot:m.167098 g.167098  ORF g.167098 m.167098 type:complete len:188 (+) comp38924_c0_seq16:832-1395(+)